MIEEKIKNWHKSKGLFGKKTTQGHRLKKLKCDDPYDMPTSCPQCNKIKEFVDSGEDPNGTGEMICDDCYRENDESILDYRGIPKCCLSCNNFEDDWNEFTDQTVYYCLLNVKLPVKKGTCARQS